jgi:hypothetical protein
VADVQSLPYVGIAQALNLTEQENPALALSQAAQRPPNNLMVLSYLNRFLRALHLQRQRCHLPLDQGAVPLPVPKEVDGDIARNAEEPATEGRAMLQGVEPIDGPEQALLADVLGILSVRHQVTAEAVQVVGMAIQENVERLAVCGPAPTDEIRVRQISEVLVCAAFVWA